MITLWNKWYTCSTSAFEQNVWSEHECNSMSYNGCESYSRKPTSLQSDIHSVYWINTSIISTFTTNSGV